MGQISVRSVSKSYKIYASRFGRLLEWLSPRRISRHQLKSVLTDISFEVRPGEAVGVIGINGAGKSTLLKMITGTTHPTSGSVTMTGRVAAMLELGMGFHPDFSGRQNVYMAGQLLGLSKQEITAAFPQIEAFAEIGAQIDEAVRTYSSGMQMRLAFSLATAYRPDILIVDEALSVGDAHFQHKSFERIREFRKQGTTLLIVSHDKAAIQSICDRAILLQGGRLAMEGDPEAVMDYYNALLGDKTGETIRQTLREDGRTQTISGDGSAELRDIALLNASGQSVEIIDVGAAVRLSVGILVNKALPRLVLGYMIKDRLGQVMYGTNTEIKSCSIENVVGGERLTFNFDFLANLGEGTYSVSTAIVGADTHFDSNHEWRDLALVFQVTNFSRDHFAGLAWLDPTVDVQRA
ncbi:ABC transporter ATP-binding protein [Robbsia sp. KACC 23696]|uniref:ABC transporter ATP-binding protein n=1 Tax=Robbsia sp. KACC 23696 TaxID=3149231 RepID=UPI00325B0EE9